MVEQESHGVREDFAQQPTGEVPQVTRPHPLYGVAPAQLRKDGVYPVAKTAKEGTPLRSGISLFGGLRSQELYAHARQLLAGLGRVVVAVSYDQPRSSFGDLWEHGKLAGIGRSYRDAADHPRPANSHMHPKAVEGLLEEGVLAETSLPFEALAAMGSGEGARSGKGIES